MTGQDQNASQHECPGGACFELLAQKWTAYLVWALQRGPRRFSELALAAPGMSDRMLSVRLKSLERAGIVMRRQFEQIPPRVEYSLTERGRGLAPVIEAMEVWSARWPNGSGSSNGRGSLEMQRGGHRRAGSRGCG